MRNGPKFRGINLLYANVAMLSAMLDIVPANEGLPIKTSLPGQGASVLRT